MRLFKKRIYSAIKKGIPSNFSIPAELEKLCDWHDKNGYPISGEFCLNPDDGETIKHWFGTDKVSDRFGVFGSGPDGSLYSFWIDEKQRMKIVHLGSEGSELFILANNFLDFLRLLSIGYDEIGFADLNMTVIEWNKAIEENPKNGINEKFQKWIEAEFKTSIPAKGSEIIDKDDKSFENWVNQVLESE